MNATKEKVDIEIEILKDIMGLSVQCERKIFRAYQGVRKASIGTGFRKGFHRNEMEDRLTKIILACILINCYKWKTIPKDGFLNEFCKRYLI